MAKEIHQKDLYQILGVSENATDKELVKGYRKRALKCHPDKNADNPRATELFLELSKALEILTDVAARAAYDQARKAKKAAEERNKVLDVKRKKFKDDLEEKERLSEQNLKRKSETVEKDLQREIERLRKEGSRLLQQEQERLRQELRRTDTAHDDDDNLSDSSLASEVARIKLKWKAPKDDPQNGGYSADVLQHILSHYGQINTLLVSSKRNGSAIVEFEKHGVTYEILDEKGLANNPFTIIWLSGKPTRHEPSPAFSNLKGTTSSDKIYDFRNAGQNYGTSDRDRTGTNVLQKNTNFVSEDSGVSDRNYESLVLMKMRQAEERKRLIEQLKNEGDGNI